MKCPCCGSTEKFPETSLFEKDFPGWCMKCIHNQIEFLYSEMQASKKGLLKSERV